MTVPIDIQDEDHFEELLGHPGLVVIDFWAEFCGPCRRMADDYKALARKYPTVKFLKCNTRECDGVPERHGVRSLPTFIFYKNRQRQNDLQFVGADVEKLERVVQQNIMPTTFTGSGNRLGGSGSTAAPASTPAPAVNARPQEITSEWIHVDDGKPTTKIQFRMEDGRKLIQKFNHDHTMSDLFLFVGAQDNFDVPFVLRGGYPPSELGDDGSTLKAAGLLNSVLIHKTIK